MTVIDLHPNTDDGHLYGQFTVQDRALILRTIGEHWYDTVDTFSPAWDKRNPALIEDFMVGSVRRYVHPSHSADDIRLFMLLLADQIKAHHNYVYFGDVPDSLEDEAYGAAPNEVIVSLLEDDIDLTLWYLLNGEAHPCITCKRQRAHVWSWEAADWPQSGFCAYHLAERAL